MIQGAVEDSNRLAGEVYPVSADGGTDQPSALGDLKAGEGVAAEPVRPVGGQSSVGAAGDGVFGDAAFWGEVPRDEVIAAMPVRRGGGDDDPADGVTAGSAAITISRMPEYT